MPSALLSVLLWCAQDPVQVGVTFKEAPNDVTDSRYRLTLNGTCDVPDGVFVRTTLFWHTEFVTDRDELRPDRSTGFIQDATVDKGKFTCTFVMFGSGRYDAVVEIPLLLQKTELPEGLKTSLGQKHQWTFEYVALSPDLPEKMAERLPGTRSLIADLRKQVDTLETATVTEDEWKARKNEVQKTGWALVKRSMDEQSLQVSLHATTTYLTFVANSLDRNSRHFIFRDGKLMGCGKETEPLDQSREEGGIWWKGLRAALDEALKIAGREYSLQVVKLLRAGPEKTWPAIRESLAKTKPAPELHPWLERLRTCTPADLDPLEKDLRAATVDVPK